MAIKIEDLKIGNIVLSPKDNVVRRCLVRAIRDDVVSVDNLNMQTGKMERLELNSNELEPVLLMESTLYALGFRKTDNIYYGSPTNICYVLRRKGYNDIVVIKTSQWHLIVPNDKGSFFG